MSKIIKPFQQNTRFPNWYHVCANPTTVFGYVQSDEPDSCDILGTSRLGLSLDNPLDIIAEIVWVGPRHHTIAIARYAEFQTIQDIEKTGTDPLYAESFNASMVALHPPEVMELTIDIAGITTEEWLGVVEQLAAKFLYDEEAGVNPVFNEEKFNAVADADQAKPSLVSDPVMDALRKEDASPAELFTAAEDAGETSDAEYIPALLK